MQALQNVTFSNFLHFSQFKITKQVKSLVKIKWLKKYTILRRFCFLKKCLPTCRIHEHFNVKTAVNFAVDFNKIPGNGDLWIPRKVYNVCMVSELAAENLAVITCSYAWPCRIPHAYIYMVPNDDTTPRRWNVHKCVNNWRHSSG